MSTKQKPSRPSPQSLGKIYTATRQPLSQISFYPKSAFIDHYYLDTLTTNTTQCKQKVIKFVGDQSANISLILDSLDALNAAQNKILMAKHKTQIRNQFSQILAIFYHKIHKIRQQRNALKQSVETQRNQHVNRTHHLQNHIQLLNAQIVELKKQKLILVEKLQNESKKKQFFQRQNLILLEHNKISTITSPQIISEHFPAPTYFSQIQPHEPNLLDCEQDDQFHQLQPNKRYAHLNAKTINASKTSQKYKSTNNSLQNDQTMQSKLPHDERQQLQKMLRKHNLNPSQLEDLIAEYFNEIQQNRSSQLKKQQNSLCALAKNAQSKIPQSKSIKHSLKLNHLIG